MCMDLGPFLLIQGDHESSLGEVNSIFPQGDKLKIIDVFGKTREIAGSIKEIDLLNRRIVVG